MTALWAEWTKMRTLRSTWWTLFALIAVTVGLGAALAAGSSSTGGGGDNDLVRDSLVGVYAGQLATVAFGALAITSEHATRMILVSFAAIPRRGAVLLAKAVVVGGAALAAGLVASAGAFVIGQDLYRDGGYTGPGYPAWTLADGPAARAVVGTALFVAGVALLSLGVGAIVRSSAAAITLVIGLLLVPLILPPLLSERAGELVQEATPGAGLAVQQTRERADALPIDPWPALGVTGAWAAGALLVAYVAIRRRDP